uniref:Uncharacterized protein n=1 Tax=Chlorella vulgaris TaxID=3077 RepID=V9H0Y6_CHLVU|nr:hypothetical protein ChvulCp094 [Chlorella vulgaris]pir/T07281/ NADH dehydrogenase (ubiquinone) chain 2 homolog - Chlorella vulgaris chloroplast [Chlorella vulgaris]BAA57929.1 unnamed protein product [Chlorella vulgaris]
MKTTNLALKKFSSIIVIGVIFFSSPAYPLVFVGGLFFGFGFIFFSYRNSVAGDLKSKLEARSGISLFFVGYYSGYFIIFFFSLLSCFFPKLEKGFLIFGDKFLNSKTTQLSVEKRSY